MRATPRVIPDRLALAVVVLALALAPGLASADWPPFGRALTTTPGDQLGAVIAPDGAGGAIVAWREKRLFPFNIDVQHVLASGDVDGSWPADGRALLTDALARTIVPQGKESPAVVSDTEGGAIVVWPDARDAATGLDIFAQHILPSGIVDPTWPANGATVCSVPGEQSAPVVVSDLAGGAFIAWVDGRASTVALDNADIYAHHVMANGHLDPLWPANGTPVTTAPKPQLPFGIVGDGVGGVLVAWTDLRSGNPGSDIYAQHLSGTGAVDPAWPLNGLGLSTAAGTQFGSSMIPDLEHGAIVAWTDTRDGTNQIFAHRVSSAGTIAPGWPVNGRLISIGGTDEVLPALASDGVGGAIVAWGGGNTGHHNSRAQHLLASGALDPAWPATGRSLGFTPSEATNQVIASDGAGGAIIAWQQSDDVTEIDIFAQHVLSSGELDAAYPVDGRAVAALPNLQHEPAIVATGAGGAIVAWMDTRNGIADNIFALQVLQAGTVDVPGPTGLAEISFAHPSPDPARGPVTLRYALPRAAAVRLAIFDITGRRVRELRSGMEPGGSHAIAWDLRDERGAPVGVGTYFARLEVERHTFTHKVTRVR
jgi:flagellar hook capping protein FlgD